MIESENLNKQFVNTYKTSSHDINKFIVLLWKGFYPYKYIDDWEKFYEISFSEKKDFHSHLNMEDVTNAD